MYSTDRYGFGVRAQPARDFIGRFPGSLEPLAGLSQLQELNLRNTDFTGQSEHEFCGGTTSTLISLADSRNTGSISNSRPIKDAHSDSDAFHWSVRIRFVVRAQPGSHAIGGNRGSSTTAESESIDDSESRGMPQSHWSVSFWFCAGATFLSCDWWKQVIFNRYRICIN